MDLIIGGDHNIDLLKVSISNILEVQFYNTNNFPSIAPTITRPSRITRTSWTLLDTFFRYKFGNL